MPRMPGSLRMDERDEFRASLLDWFATHRRDLPWRRTTDPYAIWISEIMLQQTRVAAVIPYYERFLERFPTLDALADAEEPVLLAHWAGLGYYHRARNLRKAAQAMQARGGFPLEFEEIRQLPGIGPYTAAAVASIAFGLPHAAVDGNVLRVLSRVHEDSTNIASLSGRKHFAKLANEKLDRAQPGAFNQAMMELGATVCLPGNPQCLLCPVARLCRGRASGRQAEFPVKLIERRSIEEHRTVFWIERQGSLLLWQREASSRFMPGFWELPEQAQMPGAKAGRKLGSFRHSITIHNYRFDVIEPQAAGETGTCEWVPFEILAELPVSTIVRKAKRAVDRGRKNDERWQVSAAMG